jgi:hypothetical protein
MTNTGGKGMTHQEAIKIFWMLAVAYPKFDCYKTKEQLNSTVQLWKSMFADIQYQVMVLAVKKLMLESPYPPTVHDINKKIAELERPDIKELTAADAWGELTRSIRKYGMYDELAAKESLSPLTRKIVDYIGFREICLNENLEVLRGQFFRMFEQLLTKEKEKALVPDWLKESMQKLVESKKIPQIENKYEEE